MHWPDINREAYSQQTLSVSQILMHNTFKGEELSSGAQRHHARRELPLPVYLGIIVHRQTGKRSLIDVLFHLGMSVSYDKSICHIDRFYQLTLPMLPVGQFGMPSRTEELVHHYSDNIDNNPSSTTAKDSFQGTGISIFQHPDNDRSRQDRQPFYVTSSPKCLLPSLQVTYTSIPPSIFCTKPPVPSRQFEHHWYRGKLERKSS